MRALVAGGAGFIGSHLCEFLLAEDFQVACLDNLSTGRKRNISHLMDNRAFTFVRADICEPVTLPGRIDVVFNLASPASPKDYQQHPLQTLETGATGTRNLLDLCLKKRALFLLASTSEVYGDPDVHPQKESYWGRVNPVGPRSMYDEAKRYAEALTMAYHRTKHVPTRIARIFNTYGPRMKVDDGRIVPNLIDQCLSHRPLTIYGSGRQTRSFCYVSDMVEGLFRLSGCSDPHPVNLGNPDEFTVLRLARLIINITGSNSKLTYHPLPEDDPRRRRPSIARARRLLGWKPKIRLEPGLRKTVDWFRSRHVRAK